MICLLRTIRFYSELLLTRAHIRTRVSEKTDLTCLIVYIECTVGRIGSKITEKSKEVLIYNEMSVVDIVVVASAYHS